MKVAGTFRNILFIVLLTTFLIPMLFLFISSISPGWSWPLVWPEFFTLKAWKIIVQDTRIVSSLFLTIYLSGVVVILNLLIAIPAGKALAHYDFKFKSIIDVVLMLPILIPGLGIAMGVHFIMLKLGLANSLPGVALIHLIPTLPYSIRLFRAGFENLGIRWEEQARSLGIPPLGIIWGIWFPLILPTVRGVIFLTFIISLSQYVLTALIGGGNVLTLALIYFPYFNSSSWSIMAGLTMLFAALPIAFLLIIEIVLYFLNPFSKGLTHKTAYFIGGTKDDK